MAYFVFLFITMYFKMEYVITPLIMPEKSPLELDLGGSHALRVEIRCPTSEERGRGHKTGSAMCIAHSEREPSESVRQTFEQIDAGDFTPPSADTSNYCEYTNVQGMRITIPGLDGFPEFFRSFLQDVRLELNEAAQRAVRVLRWRTNEPGPPRPFGALGSWWSFDGKSWYPIPSKLSVLFLGLQNTVHLAPHENNDILTLLRAGQDEPMPHVLFREAWEQRSSNPGSSLVIGMTALEVGVKSLIASLVPDASWLAMHVPTPPLIQILAEYLPQLPAKHRFGGEVKPPPLSILNEIRKGVSLRNGVAHRGQHPPDFDGLERILLAVKDSLWLFDYYAGHSWAFNHLRIETRDALNAVTRGATNS